MCHVLNFQMTGISDKLYKNWRKESSLRAEMIRKSLRKKYSDSDLKIRRTEISKEENGTIKGADVLMECCQAASRSNDYGGCYFYRLLTKEKYTLLNFKY